MSPLIELTTCSAIALVKTLFAKVVLIKLLAREVGLLGLLGEGDAIREVGIGAAQPVLLSFASRLRLSLLSALEKSGLLLVPVAGLFTGRYRLEIAFHFLDTHLHIISSGL